MDLAHPNTPAARRPGRMWTVRVSGHSDRTASVTCSSPCGMPPRSRDLAALRRFAEAHAAAHARAATVHPDAACACRQTLCAAHEGSQVHCMGSVVLVLRHDPAIAQVWTLLEVCAACAPLMTHTRITSRALPRTRTPDSPAALTPVPTAPATRPAVAGGFSAPTGPGFNSADAPSAPSRRRSGGRGRPQPRQGRRDQGRSGS
ncbi:hypothetical protein [Streptomyces mirabilis]|uniref:Uncharacterized protein n=1 Tax=Streptomyces mirabilis TaxID=68239 RepID=A0ABU3V512_9ACTN|nr:hypothetical protein [Streptomyces mirabilis]MCX5355614.1 hypothetical protein [Streptomyces mirabilis]MDU9001260.1 hypothetical protein [Streptomyces mirabilis]